MPQDFLDAMSIEDRGDRWAAILRGEIAVPGVPLSVTVVAELDGRVLAFASIGRFRDEPDDETTGELWAMYAHPDAWGQGLGHALMEDSFRRFRADGLTRARLWVFTENERGRAFYERQNWQADGASQTTDLQGTPIAGTRYTIQL